MNFGLGLSTLKAFCNAQDTLTFHRAKLSGSLFNAAEKPVFDLVEAHVIKHHALPKMITLEGHFPDLTHVPAHEPPSYYLEQLEHRFFYGELTKAMQDANDILKGNQSDYQKAMDTLMVAQQNIRMQKYRHRIMDIGAEAPKAVKDEYFSLIDTIASFGWPYMDHQMKGGLLPGEMVSFIGRPAAGKTWLMLEVAYHNWKAAHAKEGRNVLFVSMEMMNLPVAQRLMARHTGFPIQQLKGGQSAGFATNTLTKFLSSMETIHDEKAKFYVIDGNLAATVEDIFMLADMLGCKLVVIDGGYLLRHKNPRLDRFTRAAENAELIKRATTDLGGVSFTSWQFSREASKKKNKGQSDDEIGLEDIGYSDAIGQVSSVVLGLFQEEGVETLVERKIRCMKGRDGQVGQFKINWNFMTMDFHQVEDKKESGNQLQWV